MNVYDDIPRHAASEEFVQLLTRPGIRIERIVSHGHASPPGHWYDEAHSEWVLVLEGRARLRFEDEPMPRMLSRGECIDIGPHRRHRVDWTDPDMPTVWLAVHYG